MFFGDFVESSYSVYKDRRAILVDEIIKENKNIKSGLVLLFGGFEKGDNINFEQESTFYYFSGLIEPGLALAIEFDDKDIKTSLFVPNLVQERKKWFGHAIEATEKEAQLFYLDKIDFLGDKPSGITLDRYFDKQVYVNILNLISDSVKDGMKIFVLKNNSNGFDQKFVLNRVISLLPEVVGLDNSIVDISDIIAKLRRKKDLFEVGKISEAINVTLMAHESGARIISEDGTESEVQASVEFVFTLSGAKRAYCTIIAGGINATSLHYNDNSDELVAGDLIIVDAGAKLDGYCADITRTYPVSGTFNKRQEELYNIVLEAQKYIADIAKPGYYLNNSEHQEKCLTCLTKEFFKKYSLDQYFIHGIGHFLGLDVHDVGDLKMPIKEGDVITIEPGIYISEESIGIRIEDNYWITGNKAICLSEMIPKEMSEVCEFMKNGLNPDQE